MNDNITLHTRREFLRASLLGGALTWTVPAFLANTFSALHAEAAQSPAQAATGRDSGILVVLQLAGGNDGLNAVVPYNNDFYRRARPRLGVEAKTILKINDEIGLHPSLAGLKDLYDAGNLSIVQGIGYPNPNRSHFRSTEIWQTASDSEKFERYGWIGRYFDNCCGGADPTVGVSIGTQMPQAFAAAPPPASALTTRKACVTTPPARAGTAPCRWTKNLPRTQPAGGNGRIPAQPSAPSTARRPMPARSLIFWSAPPSMRKSVQTRFWPSRGRFKTRPATPAGPLGNSLKMVAKLIGGGLPTRIFYVSQGGYDTHTNQAGQHQRLLRELGDSVKAFMDDLKEMGASDRVLLMTFSEFGRRVTENANGGTDHGAAAPMFVAGPKVKAGLHGRYPSLAPADLVNGDIAFNVDFRSLYAGVLEQWLKTKSAPILGRQFEPLLLV